MGLNSNFFTLIPKVKNADMLESYYPIVLGNFLFKIGTKIINGHLDVIVSRILLPNQFGFIFRGQIQDCIVVASNCVNILG